MVLGPVPEKEYVVFLEGHCAGCGRLLQTSDLVVRLPVLRVNEVDLPIVATSDSPLEVLIHLDCFRYVFAKPLEGDA